MKHQWNVISKFYSYAVLSEKDKIRLLSKLKDLLEHGFTLSDSFDFLLQHTKIRSLETKLLIKAELQHGAYCSQILKLLKYPKSIIMLIYFAEMFGDLTDTLPHAQEYLLRNYKIKKRLFKTIQYPLLLLSIFIIMLIIINHTIIPEFQNLYHNMGVEISSVQRDLSFIILNLPSFIWYLLLVILLTLVLFWLLYIKLPIHYKLKLMLSMPIVSKFFKLYKTFRLSSEFSLFYKNGISLQKIVDIYSEQKDDSYLNYLANALSSGTQKGLKLSEILTKLSCFEKELVIFIEEGEKKGRLEVELKLYSEIIIDKIQQSMQFIIKFIQPCIFLVIAIMIVSLYLVIMLPMFDLMQTIK
ncbi:type II secretion system F family protein [Staphylococcus xylosus]|uniref:competence type IV pilus assembly protein ComGB n=1 Tax=Staphylococcus xylosus TaxID=1288 RepID=UPI002DBA4A97|nr:competence type IV pilus assembly protein ComGB [Staphylococcus xylosus]MEB6289978.1 type II secretion system F family protein [Staphylococcus xylosus]MEB7718528.1 type II secretion system F family protein [Staphylococcus xylosus]MEB7813540.1 type II secretion system F family protein [Staphylococcus xylosus]MEB7821558.1 type II secretion system F family protein [Staphylococcus xylosus]MEB7836116.1 type II secretion system F family protein [Staphylococcus xylosus]